MIGCVLLFLCLYTEAQEIVNLTAQQVRIDSLLPVYTYQKQLGSHYADSLWHASIEYPLFVDMSSAEVKRYQQVCGEPLPAWPEVSQSVEVARKQGVLEVSFVPLVYRDGKYQKLVSFKLNVEAKPKQIPTPSLSRGEGSLISLKSRSLQGILYFIKNIVNIK